MTLYNILSFQILVPCYKLHARGSALLCFRYGQDERSSYIHKEQVHLWYKCWRTVKNDLIFEENIMCSESVQV